MIYLFIVDDLAQAFAAVSEEVRDGRENETETTSPGDAIPFQQQFSDMPTSSSSQGGVFPAAGGSSASDVYPPGSPMCGVYPPPGTAAVSVHPSMMAASQGRDFNQPPRPDTFQLEDQATVYQQPAETMWQAGPATEPGQPSA